MRLRMELAALQPEDLAGFLTRNASDLIHSEHPFADYMRVKLKEKGILQQDVFLAADLPERYGYKLISEQKHTARRDTILRLCIASRFDLRETDEALMLYGMPPLYERFPRDAALIMAFHRRINDIHTVDTLLRENGLSPFLP